MRAKQISNAPASTSIIVAAVAKVSAVHVHRTAFRYQPVDGQHRLEYAIHALTFCHARKMRVQV